MKSNFITNNIFIANMYDPKFCKKNAKNKNQFLLILKYFYSKILKLALQTNKTKNTYYLRYCFSVSIVLYRLL